MPKPFYSIALRKTSLFIQAAGLLPFLSGSVHALDENKWVNTPPQVQKFYPIAFPGASEEEISVTESSQYIAVVNNEEQPVLLRSQGAGQVPFTDYYEFLNTFFTYPVTHNTYRVGDEDYRVTTVGGSGYRTFNYMRTQESMRQRHSFFLERAQSPECDSQIPSVRLSRELIEEASQSNPDHSGTLYENLLSMPNISRMFTTEQGELTKESDFFFGHFYKEQNEAFPSNNPQGLSEAEAKDEAARLSPDFDTRAERLAENIIENRSGVLNIFRTTAEELEPIINALNHHENVTASLISASQHGAFRPSIEEIRKHATRTDEQGRTRQAMITDAFIFIRYSDQPDRPQPIPTAVYVSQIDQVEPSEGYVGNQHLPAAIQFPGNDESPGLLLVSLLSGRPSADLKLRLDVLENIRRVLNAHGNTPAILTNYTYKSGSQNQEQERLLDMRTNSSMLKENSMPGFFLGGDDAYSASNPVIKALLDILRERSGYTNSNNFSETSKEKKDDDHDDDDKKPCSYMPGPCGLSGTLSPVGSF